MPESSGAMRELAVGSTFGGFEITGVLGRGAMGVVYRATDVRLHRPVALKVVATHLAADDAFRDRFVAEARATAMVDHPGVVAIYASGEEGSTPFIAMKVIDGPELSEILDKAGRLAPQEALAILEPIAAGLDAAATAGIVHRDVKPSNILVPRDGSGAVLVDFGIGRIKGSSRATESGSWVGTADYVAPEQIRGGDIDGRADQYSLACVLYELLVGQPPFVRDETMQTLWAHVNEAPPSIVGVVSGASDELDAVVRRGLAKNPDERFSSATEMINEARAACGLPVTARAVPVPTVVHRGPTGTVVGADASAVTSGERPRTGTVIAGAPQAKSRRGLWIGIAVAAAAIVAIGIAIAVGRNGESSSPDAATTTPATNPTTEATSPVVDTAAAQAEFDRVVNRIGQWRVSAIAPNKAFVAQVEKCASAGDASAIGACMKPVASRPVYDDIAHWFDDAPAAITKAFESGASDAEFAATNKACYDRANRAIELGTARAALAGDLYRAYARGQFDAASSTQGKIDDQATTFNGAWGAFINACDLPKRYLQ